VAALRTIIGGSIREPPPCLAADVGTNLVQPTFFVQDRATVVE
jgi:hypothetical protein